MPLNDKLFNRLRMAKRPDLLALLSDLRLDSQECKNLKKKELIDLISRQLRSAAGNSIVNIGRDDHELSYKQILVDVADKLTPGWLSQSPFKIEDMATCEDIENYIFVQIEIIWKKHIDSLSSSDRAKLQVDFENALRESGVPSQIATGATATLMTGVLGGALVAPVVATAVFGGLWTMLFGLTTAQIVAGGLLGGGPIGLVFAGVAVATGPSYKKTIPCVVRLIFIKRSYEIEKSL